MIHAQNQHPHIDGEQSHTHSHASFDIRNFTDQLERTKVKSKYICPVCSGHNLSIDEKTGKYQCFNGCECREIREALKPWHELQEERRQNNGSAPKIPKPPKSPKSQNPKNKPLPIPDGELATARLNEIPTDIPQAQVPQFTPKRVRETLSNKGVTQEELEHLKVVTYKYNDNKASYRYQAPSKANEKGYEKTFGISAIDQSGKQVWSKGTSAWAAYRQDEAIAQIKAMPSELVPVLLYHEGEKCVEAGRAERLAGITSVGSATHEELVYILNDIKSKLDGRTFVLAICQDNDSAGHEKAEKVGRVCIETQIPFTVVELLTIYPKLCDKGDIVDILAAGMTGDELAKSIIMQIDLIKSKPKSSNNSSNNSSTNKPPSTKELKTFCQKAFKDLYGDKPWIYVFGELWAWNGTNYEPQNRGAEIAKIANYCDTYQSVKIVVDPETEEEIQLIKYPYADPKYVNSYIAPVRVND